MSWNNVLPAWMLFEEYEQHLAMCSCAFSEEWWSGISREHPKYLWSTHTACFESYEEGRWNCHESSDG